MISKSNDFSRRILNFPAIRPCESVSLTTLLTSLINLGHRICSFKSRIFFTQKKNATTLIRSIETLLLFLEDISGSQVSTVLCLSELHFIFQKIQFLLEDCSRNDARLWILMKSEEISTHFRLLMRATAVALDVLPVSQLDIEEWVGFVRKQAVKSQFEVEEEDRRGMRRVLWIINLYKGGIAPESRDLEVVLEQLEIRSWNDCNNEIKFLEGELRHEYSTAEKRAGGFLSDLTAIMIHCRCTLFANIDSARYDSLQQRDNGIVRFLNPDEFKCPISLEIMTDPVVISTGHTYDRQSILKWFRSGNRTCPMTGERLISIDLVSNQALKRLINLYCHENGIQIPKPGDKSRDLTRSMLSVNSVATEQAMSLLASFLVGRLLAGTDEEKNKAAYEIRLLTKTSIFNRSCLAEAGAVLCLLNLVCSNNPGIQENAMAALLNLSKDSKSKVILVENGGLELIVDVLQTGVKAEARQHAAGMLFYLVKEHGRTIGRTPGAIPGLIALIKERSDHGKKNALVTFFGLLMHPDNHKRMLSAGLILLLVNLLASSEREDLVIDSLAILATLAENLDGAMAIVNAGALPKILDILSSCNSRAAKEFCVSLLLALCINDGADVVPVLVMNPSLMVSLYSLLADGTSRSSRKASSLIGILHAYNEKSTMAGAAVPQEHFVHVW